ncbi:MAG: hypothetical protein WA484_02865 [Solirubrobacteraceae bacterium]
MLPKRSYKVIPIERLGVSLLIRGNEGWCECLALCLCRADGGVGKLLELARFDAGGQITNVQIVDSPCRELGLKPACVGERVARASHAASLTDIDEDVDVRCFERPEERPWLKAIGTNREDTLDQLCAACR